MKPCFFELFDEQIQGFTGTDARIDIFMEDLPDSHGLLP